MNLKAIGKIHSPFKKISETPKRPDESDEEIKIEVFKEYAEGLKDLEGFSHVYIICFLDKVKESSNFAYPPQDGQKRGVFATRSPHRPNPISLSRVRLERIEDNIMVVKGLDVLDQTPLIDIKPYAGRVPKEASFGWLERYD